MDVTDYGDQLPPAALFLVRQEVNLGPSYKW